MRVEGVMKTPIFITFEGGEGTGKTTQLGLLQKRLEKLGREVTLTREPGGTPLGVEIRRHLVANSNDPPVPTAELFLYAADRAQHVEGVIKPALAAGHVVLCDRYADATVAYQGFGRGLDRSLINELNKIATGGLWPKRTLLIELDHSEGVRRSLAREAALDEAESRFEEEEAAFHKRVAEGYRALMKENRDRFRLIDGDGTVEEVEVRVWEALKDLFGEAS